MPDPVKLVRIPSLKTVDEFRRHTAALQIDLPCDEELITGSASPLLQPVPLVSINGKTIGNRYAVQPMEGWDGTTAGHITDPVRRRWQRFGQTGAKLICGGEAMAVRPDGRANPNQLLITDATERDLAELRQILCQAHARQFGSCADLVIGFQLTHSGRFCKPHSHTKGEPRVAYRHPILDAKFGVVDDSQVFSDHELEALAQDYIHAARVAWRAGADFVDIKHCHGYLLHELLGAHTRPGRYGGTFENRTRMLREIVAGIRNSGNPIDVGVRLSAFDFVPFRPDPAVSRPGKPGPGVPEQYDHCMPYAYGFGVDGTEPTRWDLSEALRFADLCRELGIKVLNVTGGSPYYNPHVQRPAAYPPSDGYQPPEDPLVGVARHVQATRLIQAHLALSAQLPAPIVVGSAYSYLQEFLPHVAQGALRNNWTDMVGLGRMILSYPRLLADATETGRVQSKAICRTFSDCTTAPRKGLISGCYPLDPYYAESAQAAELKKLKRSG